MTGNMIGRIQKKNLIFMTGSQGKDKVLFRFPVIFYRYRFLFGRT